MGLDYSYVFVVERERLAVFHDALVAVQASTSEWTQRSPWPLDWEIPGPPRAATRYDECMVVDISRTFFGFVGGPKDLGCINTTRYEGETFALYDLRASTTDMSREFLEEGYVARFMRELAIQGQARFLAVDTEDKRLRSADVPSRRSRRELDPPLEAYIPRWFLMASSAEDALQAKSEDERSLSDLEGEGMTPADLAVMRADYGYLESVDIDGFARALLDRNRELALP